MHEIDSGIDTGDIIDQIKFKIRINDTAYENYLRLMRFSIILLKKNLFKILSNNYKSKKQKLSNSAKFLNFFYEHLHSNKIKLIYAEE